MQALNGEQTHSHDLDSPEYDPVDHLNAIFSHPATLSSAAAVSAKLRSQCSDFDIAIDDLAARRAAEDADSLARMRTAQSDLSTLFQKIDRLRERAMHTEQMITDMTADIKRLDGTKKNLTLSMTALKRLQMLTTAYEQLRGLSKGRQYRECASLLAAVIQLMAHFKSYRSIDQIATLSRKVSDVQRELLDQVCEDFELAFSKGDTLKQRGTLSEGCQVIDALGENAKARLVTWYCNATLKEYRNIFRGSDEAGSLDNISRRYAWFNRLLKTYDAEHAAVFPAHWRVNELLANSFCQSTREDFRGILQKSARRENGQTIDVSLLLSCLQETLDFEHALEKRFAADPRRSVDTVSSAEEKPRAFEQAISEAFEPYLSLWVEAQDKHLAELIPKYRAQPMRAEDEDFQPQLVLPSSGELFGVYRVELAQCAKLSTGSRLLELSRVFGKYLDQYSQQVLFHRLADKAGTTGPSLEDAIMVLNTADYCYTTTNQLEEKIKSRIDEDLKAQVDLQSQADTFMGVAGAAVRLLARRTASACDGAWREMRAAPWSRMENVTEQSSYVSVLSESLRSAASQTLPLLSHKPAFARAYCDAVIDGTSSTFLSSLSLCKPIAEPGAEQLLLDLRALRTSLSQLPTLPGGPSANQPAPASFSKRVITALSRPEPLLRTLTVRPDPPEALVQAYLLHMADGNDANFRTLLELKGIVRRPEQAPLQQLFSAHRAAHPEGLAVANPLFAALSGAAAGGAGPANATPAALVGAGAASASVLSSTTSAASSVAASAASQGTALALAAVPAGVAGTGLFGASPAGSGAPSRVASPPSVTVTTSDGGESAAATGNINENLRNLGKFFRRDFGGFGGGAAGRK